MSELDVKLKEAGIFADRPLADPHLRPDDTVRFSKASFRPEEILFGDERALTRLIRAQIGNAGPFKHLVEKAVEARLNGARIDLLCVDTRPGARRSYVIIELKRALGSDRLAGQVRRYVRSFKSDPRYAGKPVRVLIVAFDVEPDNEFLLASVGVPVEIVTYRIALQTREIETAAGSSETRPPG